MNREEILSAVREAAAKNMTESLSEPQFERLTGITSGEWEGTFWARWNDVIKDAGLKPNKFGQDAYEKDFILMRIAELTRKHQKLPVRGEFKLARRQDATFPSHSTIASLGTKPKLIELLRDYVQRHSEFADIVVHLPDVEEIQELEESENRNAADLVDGHVYMVKSGRHYKIGKTYSVPRRHREIALELPEKPDVVHSIRTDDPDGIEKYWHSRFAQKRTNGEWFSLSADDVRAFKRRKFM